MGKMPQTQRTRLPNGNGSGIMLRLASVHWNCNPGEQDAVSNRGGPSQTGSGPRGSSPAVTVLGCVRRQRSVPLIWLKSVAVFAEEMRQERKSDQKPLKADLIPLGTLANFPTPTQDSSVAQLVEQAAVNRRVVGSSPTGGAFFPKITVAQLVEQVRRRRINRRVVGSSPTGGAFFQKSL